MLKRHRRDSYDYDYDREPEANSYHSFHQRSPPQSEWRDSKHVGPATKTWINPNLQTKLSYSRKENTANRHNDSRSFREDPRNFPSHNRSRSPQHKVPRSPPSPPSRRLSNQPSNHAFPDFESLPLASKSDISVHGPGNAAEQNHVETESEPERECSPGFNIRGRSAIHSERIDIGNAIRGLDTEPAAMGPNQHNGIYAPANDQPKAYSLHLELLMNHLSQFSQTLSTHASLTNEQGAVEAKLAKVLREREKWRAYHPSFVSMSEDQEKEIKDHKATLGRIKSKQREHNQAQEDAIRLIATTILSAQANDPLPNLDGKFPTDKFSARLETLEAQVPAAITTIQGAAESNAWETKTKLDELERTHEATKLELQNFKSINSESQRSTSKFIDEKLAEMNNLLSRMDVPPAVIERLNNVGSEVLTLHSKVEELFKSEAKQEGMSRTIREIEENLSTLKSQEPTYDGLVKKIDALDGNFRRLQNEVVGDEPGNPGLFAILENFEENLNQVKEEIQGVHQSIAIVQDDIEEIRKPSGSSGSLQHSGISKKELEDSVSMLSQDLNSLELTLKENYTTLRTEAESKDELVAEEMSKIAEQVTAISTQYQDLHKKITQLQNELGSQAVNGTETHTINGIHPVELGGMSHSHGPLNTSNSFGSSRPMNDVLRQHDSVLESHHNFIADLQLKFNNLTSDEMARKMVLQMQKLYPFASSVQNEIIGLRNQIGLLQGGIAQLGTSAQYLDNQIKDRINCDAETRKIVESIRNDLGTLQATMDTANDFVISHNSQLSELESRLETQGAEVMKYNQAFENVKLEATQQLATVGESIAALEKKLGSVEADDRKERTKMHSRLMLMWNERPKEHAKMASPVTTSPKSASPTASPSAPASPRKIMKMRFSNKGKEKIEDVAADDEQDDKDTARMRKRPRAESDHSERPI